MMVQGTQEPADATYRVYIWDIRPPYAWECKHISLRTIISYFARTGAHFAAYISIIKVAGHQHPSRIYARRKTGSFIASVRIASKLVSWAFVPIVHIMFIKMSSATVVGFICMRIC